MKAQVLTAVALLAFSARATDMYQRDESQNIGGTYLVADVNIAPVFLVKRFGAPAEGDGIRVSGKYAFKSGAGVIFTVHDYKSTTLWATDENLPTPEAFWQDSKPQELSIGARGSDPTAFKAWLLGEYKTWLTLSHT